MTNLCLDTPSKVTTAYKMTHSIGMTKTSAANTDCQVAAGQSSSAVSGPDLKAISQGFITGELSAEKAIELAQDHHCRARHEAGPPF